MKIRHMYGIRKGSIKLDSNGRLQIFTHANCQNQDYWWLDSSKKWVSFEEAIKSGESYGTISCKIRSVKAFKRRLKEWSEYMPKGTEFILCSNFVGYCVIGKI